MNEKEYKEFLAWFGKAVNETDQTKLEEILEYLSPEEQDDVLLEWDLFKNKIKKGKEGMKCPKGLIPNYLKLGGKVTQCGCKKPKINLDEKTISALRSELHKCGGKMKNIKKKK